MKKQIGIRVEPVRVRHARIVIMLKGRPRTIQEVARTLRVNYYTARRYLSDMLKKESVELLTPNKHPLRYYVPLRKKDEPDN
jgi:predicted ArsR family transcriptional regulator